MPIDYKQGQIYKLWSPDNLEMVYVGSTCQPLYQRLSQHKRGWKDWKTGKRYYASCDMFENCQEVKIELVELCPCNSKIELHRTEGKYIREMDCINKVVAGRTMKEYYQDTKEQREQYRQQYYEQNKQKVLQQTKGYRRKNKEVIAQRDKRYRRANRDKIKQRKKEYYESNKEAIAQRNKRYQQVNKDKLRQREKIKITCECGSVVRKNDIARHRRTQKHQRFINQQ